MRPGDLYPRLLEVATRHAIEPMVGAPYLSIAAWLHDFSSWSPARRHDWQGRRLEYVLAHAARHVPFYRDLARNGRIRLESLPIVDKAMVRSDADAFRSELSLPSVVKRTGGTTGDPWTYELDRQAWAHVYAAGIHFWERVGYRYGERVAVLGTPPSLISGANGWKDRLRRAVERRVYPSTGIETDHEASLAHARAASASRAVLWYGYASMLAGMADAVAAEGLSLPGPRAIVTTSEPLLSEWRRRIEAAFGVPVYDQYGCNDGGVLAQTCREGRFHLAENVSLLEVVEGDTPCSPGVEGELVVTNLHARVLPFLRYRVGDRAVLGEGTCPCGQDGATLERIAGRTGDRLRLPDGTELSLPGLTTAFWEAPNVRRWQLVQPELGRIRVRLELADGFDDAEAARLEGALRKRCGDAVAIELVANEPFERAPEGKLQVLISRVDA
jgi:phenylacetate-CoA ligase